VDNFPKEIAKEGMPAGHSGILTSEKSFGRSADNNEIAEFFNMKA